MANRFVSAGGSNTSPFDTWAKAANSATTGLTDAIAQMSAGDSLWCDKTTTISNTTTQTMTLPGTDTTPCYIYSATNTGAAPVAADIAAGFTVTTTTTGGQTWNGAFYMYGVTVNAGSGANSTNFIAANAAGGQYWDNCSVHLKGTTGSSQLNVAALAAGTVVTFNNTPLEFNTATSSITSAAGGLFIWQNTPSALISGTIPSALFTTAMRIIIDGCDLSSIVSGSSKFVNPASNLGYTLIVRNCKLATGTAMFQTPSNRGGLVDYIASDNGATTASQGRRRYAGSLDVSTSVSNNATDGTTAYSWTVVTTANCSRALPFECFEIDKWVAAGTYASSLVFLTSATASLTNADVWVEVEYLGSGATPVGSQVTSAPATMATAGSTLSGGSWTTGGLGNNYQIAIPSFTTALAGYVRVKIKVAKPSLTVNIDPAVTIA